MIRLYVLLAYICFWVFSNAQQRIYVENIDISKDSLCLFELKDSPIAYSIEVRAALNKNVEQDGYSSQEWGIVWNYKTAEDFSYVKIVCGNSCYGDFLDQRYADVVIGNRKNGINSIVETKRFYKGVDTSVGYNSLLFEWDNGVAKFFVGNNELKFVTKTDVGTNIIRKSKCSKKLNRSVLFRKSKRPRKNFFLGVKIYSESDHKSSGRFRFFRGWLCRVRLLCTASCRCRRLGG